MDSFDNRKNNFDDEGNGDILKKIQQDIENGSEDEKSQKIWDLSNSPSHQHQEEIQESPTHTATTKESKQTTITKQQGGAPSLAPKKPFDYSTLDRNLSIQEQFLLATKDNETIGQSF